MHINHKVWTGKGKGEREMVASNVPGPEISWPKPTCPSPFIRFQSSFVGFYSLALAVACMEVLTHDMNVPFLTLPSYLPSSATARAHSICDLPPRYSYNIT
eukprot:scaffold305711_cov27-Tisochrysis_lutea.AAC.1